MRAVATGGQLDGVRVLDLGIWRPAPYASQLLADLGADVLKVEPPGGDPMRALPWLFASVAGHKRSVVLDLVGGRDRRRALELAREADVVLEGFGPGVADRLGVGYEQARAVNPSVVYCSISGYGQGGPLAALPGHDLNFQALSGVMRSEGGDPVVTPGLAWAELASGLAAAMAICAALVARARTGEGEYVDVAMTDVLATWTGAVGGTDLDGADAPARLLAPCGTFATADGRWIAIGVVTEDHAWSGLCDALGLADIRDLSPAERVAREAELRDRLVEAFAAEACAPLLDRLVTAGVPASPVLSRAEMLEVPHLRLRGTVTERPDGQPAVAHPVVYRRRPARPPGEVPETDQHRGEGFPPRG